MNLEDSLLSGVSQSQKDKPCMISFTPGAWNRQMQTQKVERWWGIEGGELVLNGPEFQFRMTTSYWRRMVVMEVNV
jgi:hypothetical protein